MILSYDSRNKKTCIKKKTLLSLLLEFRIEPVINE